MSISCAGTPGADASLWMQSASSLPSGRHDSGRRGPGCRARRAARRWRTAPSHRAGAAWLGDSVVVEDMMNERLGAAACLPEEHEQALLVGRAWLASVDGPALVALRDDGVCDVSEVAPTASALFELDDPVAAIRGAGDLPRLASIAETLANSAWNRRDSG